MQPHQKREYYIRSKEVGQLIPLESCRGILLAQLNARRKSGEYVDGVGPIALGKQSSVVSMDEQKNAFIGTRAVPTLSRSSSGPCNDHSKDGNWEGGCISGRKSALSHEHSKGVHRERHRPDRMLGMSHEKRPLPSTSRVGEDTCWRNDVRESLIVSQIGHELDELSMEHGLEQHSTGGESLPLTQILRDATGMTWQLERDDVVQRM